MGVKERREREKEGLRRLIVDTARELFARDGFDAVSMRQIAEAIEYSPTAIYLHFKDKQALFNDICREDFHRLASVALDAVMVDDPIERLRKLGQTYISFGVEHPSHYRFMFMTPIDDKAAAIEPEDWKNKGVPSCDGFATLLNAVEYAIDKGAIHRPRAEIQLIAQTFWAGVHGVVSLEITMRNDPWIDWATLEARRDLMIESLIAGLCMPPIGRAT
jgi:AcrR family transcriptional regulator